MNKHTLLMKRNKKQDASVGFLFFLSLLAGGHTVMHAITTPANAIVQQENTCLGSIVDNLGEPVVGASVLVKGTLNGTISDVDGRFSLKHVRPGSILVVSYVGYLSQEIVWDGTTLRITLAKDTQMLDDVVVVGFGTQKKVDLTGAVSQVKMADVLGDRPVINAAAALQGAMPGLVVSGASGPGQQKSFNIRGTLSINGGSPLVLIDNVEGDLSALNPDDIESVSVLKDASSAAIYGARAACGVILVTTKHPKGESKINIDYGFNLGWERAISHPEQAALTDYIAAYEEAGFSNQYWAGNGDISRWKELLQQYQAGTLQGVRENGIFAEGDKVYYLKEGNPSANALGTGCLNNHSISLSGGTDKVRFRLSGNYSSEDGPMITNKDKYIRKAINAFVSADVAKWYTQEATLFYTNTKQTAASSSLNDPYTTRLISWYPEGYMPGELLGRDEDLIIDSPRNALLCAPTSRTDRTIPRIQLKSILKPLEGWTVTGEYTYNETNYKYKDYTGITTYADVQLAVRTSPLDPTRDKYTINTAVTKYNALNLYTNYDLTVGKHTLGAMFGFNQESYSEAKVNVSAEGQAAPNVPSLGAAQGLKTISDTYSAYAIRGGFGRLTYNFDNRYLFTFNGRYDGSSKFPKSNRFAFFPSFSVGWRLDNERFMDWTNGWLDELKLRGSYGQIGNQNIQPYGYLATMNITEGTPWINNGGKVTYFTTPGLIRANYTWEKVKTTDIGWDVNLFGNRLTATFDWYKRVTEGMLSSGVELPSTVGASAPLQNVADMVTKGWELTVNWRDRIGDVGYQIGFNLYDHRSKITKYNNETGNLKYYYEGMRLGEIWGYEADGFYAIDDFNLEKAKLGQWVLKEGVTSINGYTVQPGDVKFKDLDGDGVITAGENTNLNPGDRKIIGNNASRLLFGANLGVNWKGFDLSVMLQGVGKRDYVLSATSIFPFGGASTDGGVFFPLYANQTDFWQAKSYDPESPDYMVAKNPNCELYRVYGQRGNAISNARVSDKYLQHAAYLRVKNLTLAYTLPQAWVRKAMLSKVRLYVSCENLATFTSLPAGYDPESMSWSYPFYRTWSFGANVSF